MINENYFKFRKLIKVFDIYGVTSAKEAILYDINSKKSLLTPNINCLH